MGVDIWSMNSNHTVDLDGHKIVPVEFFSDSLDFTISYDLEGVKVHSFESGGCCCGGPSYISTSYISTSHRFLIQDQEFERSWISHGYCCRYHCSILPPLNIREAMDIAHDLGELSICVTIFVTINKL